MTATPRTISLPRQKERDFQAQVVKLARLRGWLVYHPYDSRRSAYGFPDLTLVRKDRLLFLELKTVDGKVSKPQMQWIEALATAGITARVVRPSDWDWLEEVLL